MQIADLGGIRLHFTVSGPEAGPPIAFANSLGTDLRVWDKLLPLLPPGLRVLRYDMRGHGLSDAPAGHYRVEDLVCDAAGLLERTGFHRAAFVGLSIGGLVAQGIAHARPDLVRALVLSNTAAKIGTKASWGERITAVRAGGIEAIADGVLEKWFTRGFREKHPDELAGWRHMLMRTPVKGYLGCCEALAAADLRASTASLALPVLAIAGSDDGSTPPDFVREMAQTIAGARFEVIPQTGHIPCVEAPEALAALITRFLKEQGYV